MSCCVVGCTNRFDKNNKTRKFYRIPSTRTPFKANRRRLWLQAIKRSDWNEQMIKNAIICSDHFISGEASEDFESPNFVPSIFPSELERYKRKRRRGEPPRTCPDNGSAAKYLAVLRASANESRHGLAGEESSKGEHNQQPEKNTAQQTANMASADTRSRKVQRRWTQETEEALIGLWQEHQCLFDVSTEKFHDRGEKEKSWREIALSLQHPVEEVKTRALSLRTQYSRLIKPKPGGSGSKPMTARQKWLLRSMHFIRQYIIHRPCETTSDVSRTGQEDAHAEDDSSPEMFQSTLLTPSTSSPRSASPLDSVDDEASAIAVPSPTLSTARRKGKVGGVKRSKRASVSSSSSAAAAANLDMQKLLVLKQMAARMDEATGPDAFSTFGNQVASELRQLQEPANLTRLKRNIMNMIYDAQDAERNGLSTPCTFRPVATPLPPHPRSESFQQRLRGLDYNERTRAAEHGTQVELRDVKTIQDPTEQTDRFIIQSEVPSDSEDKMNKVTLCKTEELCCFEMPIGFIGAGNMAFGMTQGILTSGRINPANVNVSAPSSNNLGRFQEMGVAITHSNTEVVASSDLVFLAVKPHLVPLVLQEIAHLVTQEHIIVSIAAGVTIATVEALLPPDSVVVRLMPNLPGVVQEGSLLLACGSRARAEHGVLLRDLLAPCGLVEEGPESWIDAHTGMSGSGVAFGDGEAVS